MNSSGTGPGIESELIDLPPVTADYLEGYVSGMTRAIEAVLDGRMDPFAMLTHAVPLETLDAGFEMARSRPYGFMKAIMLLDGRA